jgi:dephospho-CoA kinase
LYDGIILVSAPEEVRLHRLTESGNYSREEALARIDSQTTEEARAEIADWIIDNGGTFEETVKQVEIIHQSLAGTAGGKKK